ncbi:MAG: M48 family metalloprotease [Candidatus Thermoplasmatota archaeon]|nr:M48 family metalloprotease [Candidatus Thermoplasmatota archaeon]
MSQDPQSLNERQKRIKYYIRLKRLNTDFLIGEIAIVVIGQLLFSSASKAYLWLIPLLLVLVAFTIHSYLISLANRNYRNIHSGILDSANSIKSILIFPLLVMLSFHIPAMVYFLPGYIGLISGIFVATSVSIFIYFYPMIRENRILERNSTHVFMEGQKLKALKEILPETMRDSTIALTEKKGKNFANAFVIGYKKPIILMTKYMESNLTIDQLSAVIAHEYGHFVHGDSRKLRLGYTAFVLVYFNLLVLFSFLIPGLIILYYLVAYIVFYFVSLNAARKQRNMELSADIFAAKSGLAELLKSALARVDDLNFMPSDIPEGAGNTHPSTITRFNWLEQNNF